MIQGAKESKCRKLGESELSRDHCLKGEAKKRAEEPKERF